MAEWPLETSERECSQCWGDGIASGACMMVSGIAWAVRTFHKGMGGGRGHLSNGKRLGSWDIGSPRSKSRRQSREGL
jgi:hypothetical protein